MLETIDAAAARRWAVVARAALAARRAEIDGLNVFPVPDGDTGTNLYLTLDGALDLVRTEHEAQGIFGRASLVQEADALSRSMLLSARGNSGVILSQLTRGFAEEIVSRRAEELDAAGVARALARGAHLAREAVADPVEGTILTVSDAVAAAAADAYEDGADLAELLQQSARAARESLARTTDLLPVLRENGLVDAGGAGYVLLVEAWEQVVRGEGAEVGFDLGAGTTLALGRRADWGSPPTVRSAHPEDAHAPAGPAYEVMYLLDRTGQERVETLRAALAAVGDSVLVVGGPELWNVHAHVDDVGAAIEAGIEAGRPHRIRVTAFEHRTPRRPVVDQAVVACVAGPGMATLLEQAGARTVVSGPGRRASAGAILDAVRHTHALHVILLPNDDDTVLAAQVAASAAAQEGIEVHVIRSRAAVQGLSAVAVHDPAAPVAQNVAAMAAAAAGTRHGAVTVASREALTSAGRCRPGDVLGLVGDEIEQIGSDVATVAQEVVGNLLRSGGELLTVVTGTEAGDGLGEGIARSARAERRDLEVVVIDGGQPHYPVLVGVE